jgi:tRNA A-37 threonylcarbamoyl transferase component Bud32
VIITTGQLLNERYRIEALLRQGAYGQVYLVQDIILQRPCVVKKMIVPEDLSPDEVQELQESFEHEAHLLASLNHPGHPSVPEIFDFFLDASGNYLVMKYIDGESVQERLERSGGQLPWQEALGYILQVCSALDYLHGHQPEPVIHRDIKPTNILIDGSGRVWLVDYGTAQASTGCRDDGRPYLALGGTPGYTPLEQWLMKAQPTSDIYALGATLHYLVTGRNPAEPFREGLDLERIEANHGRFPRASKLNPSLPPALEEVIAKALQADPDRRPTASQWAEALAKLLPRRTAAEPFTFVDGNQACTVGELAKLCESHWDEAIQYLYDGTFELWLRSSIFRADLAAEAQTLLMTEKNAHHGVEKFIRALDPSLPAPRVVVQPPAIDFGPLTPGQPSSLVLTVYNATRGYTPFELEADSPLLAVTPASGGLHVERPIQVTAVLSPKSWQSGPIEAELILRTPGGEQHIPVSARLRLVDVIWGRLGPPLSVPFRWLIAATYAFGTSAAFLIAALFALNLWYKSGAIYPLYLLYVGYPLAPLLMSLGAVAGAAVGGWVFDKNRLLPAGVYGLLLAWGGLGFSSFAWLVAMTPLVDAQLLVYLPLAALIIPPLVVALAVTPLVLLGTRPARYTTVVVVPLLIAALVVAALFLPPTLRGYGVLLPDLKALIMR